MIGRQCRTRDFDVIGAFLFAWKNHALFDKKDARILKQKKKN